MEELVGAAAVGLLPHATTCDRLRSALLVFRSLMRLFFFFLQRPRAIRSLCYAVIVMNTCDDEHLVRHYWRQRRAYIFMRLLAILSLRFSWAGFRLAINLVPFNQT